MKEKRFVYHRGKSKKSQFQWQITSFSTFQFLFLILFWSFHFLHDSISIFDISVQEIDISTHTNLKTKKTSTTNCYSPSLSEIRKPTAESHCVLAFFQIKKKSYVFIFAYNICTSWWFILSKYLLIPNQKKLILLKIKKTAWQFSYIPSSLLIAKSHHLNDQNSP